MPFSFALVALFNIVAYLAPVVAAAALICLALPRWRALGVRTLWVGGAGAAAAAVAAAVIGALSGDAATGRGLLAGAGVGFTIAGAATALVHARRTPRRADAA